MQQPVLHHYSFLNLFFATTTLTTTPTTTPLCLPSSQLSSYHTQTSSKHKHHLSFTVRCSRLSIYRLYGLLLTTTIAAWKSLCV